MAVAVAELWFMDVYGRYNELVFMGLTNKQNWGAPSEHAGISPTTVNGG